MKIQSNSIVFMDTTDTTKIDVHIASNYPTTQIYDANSNTFTPNWEVSGGSLRLTATVYADSTDVTNSATYQWFKDATDGASLSSTKNLAVRENILKNSTTGMVTYICKATYNNKEYENRITFTLITSGKNGVDGQPGKDGVDGKDGTSVTIEGVAYAKTTPITGSTIDLYSDVATTQPITGTTTGESYLVDGYLCVYNTTDRKFICTGKIQGPKGEQGDSSYLFVRYADDANGSNMSATAGNRKYIGFARSSVNVAPIGTSTTIWGWTKFVGEDAKSIVLSANTQVFKVGKDNTVSPATLVVTAQTSNTSITEWLYSTNGGQTFSDALPTGVVRNGNQITITGKTITSNSITVRASDGTYRDALTVYKVFDGDKGDRGTDAPIAFLTNEHIGFSANAQGQIASTTVYSHVVAYNGANKVTPTIGEISGLPTGMTIGTITTTSDELIIPIIIANNATLDSTTSNNGTIEIPVLTPVSTRLKLTWSKINSGAKGDKGETGVGVKSTTVSYGVSDSASTRPTDASWQPTIPVVAEGKYLWTRTIIDYTDDTVPDTVTYTYVKQGIKGDTGSSGSSVTVTSIQYKEGTSATTAPTGTWSDSVVSVAEGKYLWTKTAFSDGKTAYGVAKQGDKGTDAVTFQLYAPNGYLLTMELPSLTLQTFAYEGNAAITTGATFKWYSWTNDTWAIINGATNDVLTIAKEDVLKSKSYKCEMTYKNNTYTATATVEDKTDIYDSLINVIAKYSPTNRLYWVLYSTVYTEEGEQDELLGPVSVAEPTDPVVGAYWYKIDETNYNITLMKYSGTEWATTTDSQALVYDWFLFNDIDDTITLGSQSKVKIVTSNDFSRVCSVQCNISDSNLMPLSHNNQILNDTSDPIVSATEPPNPIDKQLWIKIADNGTYVISIWDAEAEKWIVSSADSQNKLYTEKPVQYDAGDIWIVGGDYQPTIYINGVAQTTKYLMGTMLKAQSVSATYTDSDWVEALNYQEDIDDLKDQLNIYNQHFAFDENGITMTASNLSGQISEFKTKLTNTELGFYQGENKVAHINNNQLNISKAEITNGLTITGTQYAPPTLSIGGFSLVVESNGSLSIGYNA